MQGVRPFVIWLALLGAVAVPVLLAAQSPLLAYRSPIYIAAGFAGVLAMGVLLIQPLLAGGWLPGLTGRRARVVHRTTGAVLILLIVIHVAALWQTSPPDMIDALTFTSPTPFSTLGVIAMWALFAAAALVTLRRRLRPGLWRTGHRALALIVVAGSVVHALLIEGTMETTSKTVLCILVALATLAVLPARRVWTRR